MKCAFTICTHSYTGLFSTLRNSFLEYNPEYSFFVVYIDNTSNEEDVYLADDILLSYLPEDVIIKMKFKYDVTEYSTSIKPFIFKYLLNKGYEQVLYFDPDIMFFSGFDEVKDGRFDAYVTPHLLVMRELEDIAGETSVLKYGMYNCGFIGFSNSLCAKNFIEWWCERLENNAYNDLQCGTYTDQKWINYITIFMSDKVKIIENLGCNYAPWNMNERVLEYRDSVYWISSCADHNRTDKLVFMHFSGFNYSKLIDGIIEHNFRKYPNDKNLQNIIELYGDKLRTASTEKYLNEKYIYNYYSNGEIITKLNRRLFSELSDDYIGNPFDSNGDFFCKINRKKLLGKNRSDAKIRNTDGIGKKKKYVMFMFKLAKKMLGIDKYTELLRALQIYSFYNKQFFLLDWKKDEN